MGTNFSNVLAVDKVSACVKVKRKVSVDQPKIISQHNKGISGMDLFNML